MATYDAQILKSFADRMYARALWITVAWTVIGLILGGVVGSLFGAYGGALVKDVGGCGTFIFVAILGMIVGYCVGDEKAFTYKLEAQKILCQLQIEINTRPGADSSALAEGGTASASKPPT